MKEQFIDWAPKDETLAVVEQVNVIVAEYQALGFVLTVRQLYYQFVARDIFPPDRRWRLVGENKWRRDPNGTPNAQPNYKWLVEILSKARQAGLVDWAAIEDRLRVLERTSTWDSPEEIIAAVARQYREDLWANQPRHVEVWIEKDALIGVIEPACLRWRVPYVACRGNASQSMLYEAGKRFVRTARDFGHRTLVLHLGDHDPNGLDMTRDNDDRLQMYGRTGRADAVVDLRRIAMTYEQVQQYSPPPNPTKDTDSRTPAYREQFGDECWELDALDPTVIDRLLEEHISGEVDRAAWDRDLAGENERKADLQVVARNWDDVVARVRGIEEDDA